MPPPPSIYDGHEKLQRVTGLLAVLRREIQAIPPLPASAEASLQNVLDDLDVAAGKVSAAAVILVSAIDELEAV